MTPGGGRVAVVTPMKPLHEAKLRLNSAIDGLTRAALSLLLLEHVLRAAGQASLVGQSFVIGGDRWVRRLAEAERALWRDDPAGDLNRAVALGVGAAFQQGAAAALVLPGDLGLLTLPDIDAVIAASDGPRRLVLAPAGRDGGTNALLAPRGMLVGPFFGADSFSRHLAAARRAGLPVTTVDRPGLSFDLDTPEDLELYRRVRPDLEQALARWRREFPEGASGPFASRARELP